jgi:Protein of unknown function (DUF1214)
MMTENIGNYGTDCMMRACVELIGLGANLPDDAIYPLLYTDADGQPFTGASGYTWHLGAEELPPVNAFWSLTLYDAEGFQVANDLNRCDRRPRRPRAQRRRLVGWDLEATRRAARQLTGSPILRGAIRRGPETRDGDEFCRGLRSECLIPIHRP